MIIDLDPKTRIRGTEHCWQLEFEKIIKGKSTWRPMTYHTSFGSALREAVRREIRTTPVQGLMEAIDAVNQLKTKYIQLFDAEW